MRVLKDGKTLFEGDLKQCWEWIMTNSILVKGKKLVDGAEVLSLNPNLLPSEYTVCARADEL